jgi:L-methionine (R)-S-oxide reductase
LEALRVTQNAQDQAWLEAFIARAEGVAGTVHRIEGDILELSAAYRIPPPVIAVTMQIPRGKGMAGLAWERDKPVQTCNLREDQTGDVRPGAKAVDAKGAVALPIKAESGQIIGVVGVAYADDRELDQDTLTRLSHEAEAYLRSP